MKSLGPSGGYQGQRGLIEVWRRSAGAQQKDGGMEGRTDSGWTQALIFSIKAAARKKENIQDQHNSDVTQQLPVGTRQSGRVAWRNIEREREKMIKAEGWTNQSAAE